jgi:hypothetical protein
MSLITARLVIISKTMTAAELAQHLALSPDESWASGDRASPRLPTPIGDHGWILITESKDGRTLEQALEELKARFEPSASRMKQLATQIEKVYVSCTVHVAQDDPRPELLLSSGVIQFLGTLGAEVGIEIYGD